MKKIGVNIAARYVAPSPRSLRRGVDANIVPARNAPTMADRPITSEMKAYRNVIAIAMLKPLCFIPIRLPAAWSRTTILLKKWTPT